MGGNVNDIYGFAAPMMGYNYPINPYLGGFDMGSKSILNTDVKKFLKDMYQNSNRFAKRNNYNSYRQDRNDFRGNNYGYNNGIYWR